MEDAALLEMFKRRLIVLNANLEKLEKLRAPPNAPPTSLLRLPFEIRLQIYHYCIPHKRVIEVSRSRFNTSWPFVDRTLDFEDALDFEDDPDLENDPDLEGEAFLEEYLSPSAFKIRHRRFPAQFGNSLECCEHQLGSQFI
jgi:hypothetical protein